VDILLIALRIHCLFLTCSPALLLTDLVFPWMSISSPNYSSDLVLGSPSLLFACSEYIEQLEYLSPVPNHWQSPTLDLHKNRAQECSKDRVNVIVRRPYSNCKKRLMPYGRGGVESNVVLGETRCRGRYVCLEMNEWIRWGGGGAGGGTVGAVGAVCCGSRHP
jgi:hypothetical protein